MAKDLIAASNASAIAIDFQNKIDVVGTFDTQIIDNAIAAKLDQLARRQLVKAAKGLSAALGRLIEDETVWSRVSQAATRPIPFDRMLAISELLQQNLPLLLATLGYKPPPPGESWTEWVQGSLRQIVGSDWRASVDATKRARWELRIFRLRFERLIRRVDDGLEKEDESGNPERRPVLRQMLTATLEAGRKRAVPAAMAAGAAGVLMAGPFGAATGATLGVGMAFASEAAKTLFQNLVEAAVAAGLASLQSEPNELLLEDLIEGYELLTSGALLLDTAWSSQPQAGAIGQARFIIRRSIYGMLEASERSNDLVQKAVLWAKARSVLNNLDSGSKDQVLEEIDDFLTDVRSFVDKEADRLSSESSSTA